MIMNFGIFDAYFNAFLKFIVDPYLMIFDNFQT